MSAVTGAAHGGRAQYGAGHDNDVVPTSGMPRLIGLLSFWAHVGFIAASLGILSTAMMLIVMGPIYVVSHALRGRTSLAMLSTGAGTAILGAVLGMAMSARQVLLHIAPGEPPCSACTCTRGRW